MISTVNFYPSAGRTAANVFYRVLGENNDVIIARTQSGILEHIAGACYSVEIPDQTARMPGAVIIWEDTLSEMYVSKPLATGIPSEPVNVIPPDATNITRTFIDSATSAGIPLVSVLLGRGSSVIHATSNASGVLTLPLANGVWNYNAQAAGYETRTGTIATATPSGNITLIQSAVPAPATPDQCVVSFVALNQQSVPSSGIRFRWRYEHVSGRGVSYSRDYTEFNSGSNGLVSINALRGSKISISRYQADVDFGPSIPIDVPDADSYLAPNIPGLQSE